MREVAVVGWRLRTLLRAAILDFKAIWVVELNVIRQSFPPLASVWNQGGTKRAMR